MRAITMPTYRRGHPDQGRALWADLRVCLTAIEAYALDHVDEVIVAWDGPWAPDGMPEHPKFKYLERPKGLDMAAAWEWATDQTDADELIQMGDDVVLHPQTLPFLLEDIAMIRTQAPNRRIGMIGARSDFVAGAQNIRSHNGGTFHPLDVAFTSEGGVLETDELRTVFCWYTRSAWEHVGRFPEGCIRFGDLLMSYDMRRLGYSLFISRAYVRHIGFKGSEAAGATNEKMMEEGVEWLRANRPDFLAYALERGHVSAEPAEV